MILWSFLCSCLLASLVNTKNTAEDVAPRNLKTFTNPIITDFTDKPYVFLHSDGFYYFSTTLQAGGASIYILKSNSLINWENAEKKIVFNLTAPFTVIYEPELHFLEGEWYIYFCMQGDGILRTNYVIRGLDQNDPMGDYETHFTK